MDLSELVVARHAESTANAATWPYDGDVIVAGRDRDVPLTDRGRRQALALGGWISDRPLPEVVVCSPFRRARDTWTIASAGLATPAPTFDERLVDRGMGELELLAPAAVERRHPGESAARVTAGEYDYRPPGGESMRDVAARIAAFVADLRREHPGRRVFVVAHDAVVPMFRLVIDDVPFADLPRTGIANCSVTRFAPVDGRLRFDFYEPDPS